MSDLYYQVARKGMIDWSVGWQRPPHNFPLVKCLLRILWQSRSVDFILCQFLTFVREATWFLHASQLCAHTKVNYPATQPGRTSIKQWILVGSNVPGYLWKAERIRNLSIVKNLKKAFSLFIFKSLKNRVVAIGPRGFNWLLTGTKHLGLSRLWKYGNCMNCL